MLQKAVNCCDIIFGWGDLVKQMHININMRRLENRIHELFQNKIDMKDFPIENSKHFETRALSALALCMTSGIDIDRSVLYITDGYNDLGLDAIFLDESQKILFLVQSKWRSDGNGGTSFEEISKFVDGIRSVLSEDLSNANEKIKARDLDIDKALTQMGYQIHAVFIHTGMQGLSSYAQKPINDLIDIVNDDVSEILFFREYSFKDIYQFLANGQEDNNIDIDDLIISNWGKKDTPYLSYYGAVSASLIGGWYQTYGNKLFAKNIRFYKGNTEVNEGIKKVLINEPEKFYYYNNGIKLLCKKITRKPKDSAGNSFGLFSLSGVSLVNGAQTTGTIGSVFAENPEQVSKAYVMIQIIDLTQVDSDTSVQITRLSNTQNRIDNKDFAALDPQQERIRSELMFSHYEYLYKSGDTITNSTKQISFDEAIIALACLYPDISYTAIAKSNVGMLSEDISKAPYRALINPSTNSYCIANAVFYMREVEGCLKRKKDKVTNNRERLVCIHANRFILHFILSGKESEKDFCTSILNINVIQEDTETRVEKLVHDITDIMNQLYPESYPANIFKTTNKCKAIAEELLKNNAELMT